MSFLKLSKEEKLKIKKMLPSFLQQYLINRQDRLRDGIRKEDLGLEIGPSHNPTVSKREGYRVEVLDWLSKEELKEHYKNDGVDLDKIEDVDYVWKGGTYFDLIQKANYYDYVISSHSIEHTTDFVGFLQDMSKLLKVNGILRLAIPDKRYIFDHFREITGIGEVLNNYYYKSELQAAGMVAEYFLSSVHYKSQISWGRSRNPIARAYADRNLKGYDFIHPSSTALDKAKRVVENGEYEDIHHYCFTPASFEYLIYELQVLKLIDLEITDKTGPRGNEFIVTLKKVEKDFKEDPVKKIKLLKLRNKENRI